MQKIKEVQNEYELYKEIYEISDNTEEVSGYAQKVLQKARAIEYALCGTVYDRILKVNLELKRYGFVSASAMNDMFPWGNYRHALLDFCGLKRLENGVYVSSEHNLILKVMLYGETDE